MYTVAMSFLKGFLVILSIYSLFALIEHFRPVERNQPIKERGRNTLFMFAYLIVGGVATYALFQVLPLPARETRSMSLPLTIVIAFLAIFVWDLIFYWYHRAEHAFPWMWRIHQLHHSDGHLNTSATYRHSWLENPLQEMLISVPIGYILQLDTVGWFAFSLMIMIGLFFIHTNLRLHLGPLTPVIGGPQVHRIHHSSLKHHQDKNFAVFFPFIDKLFGTYYSPAADEFPPTGVSSVPSEASLKTALIGPFLADR